MYNSKVNVLKLQSQFYLFARRQKVRCKYGRMSSVAQAKIKLYLATLEEREREIDRARERADSCVLIKLIRVGPTPTFRTRTQGGQLVFRWRRIVHLNLQLHVSFMVTLERSDR
jgi:hypothetical protein